MQLHQFLENAGTNIPAPTRPVDFRITFPSPSGQEFRKVNAVLAVVSERDRQEALRDALKEVKKQFQDTNEIPSKILANEEVYEILRRSMRDSEDPSKPFARTALELKNVLNKETATEIYAEYLRFMEEEFPPTVTNEDFAKLVEEAKKNSLEDLVRSTDSLILRRALPGLIARFMT